MVVKEDMDMRTDPFQKEGLDEGLSRRP